MTMARDERETTARGIPTDTFGRRLMLARDYAGNLSIRDAADLCGIGRGAWTNWERGARPVDMLDVVEIISEKLSVDRDWLLFGGALAKAESPLRSRLASRLRRDTEEYGASVRRTRPAGMRTPLSALVVHPSHQPEEPGVLKLSVPGIEDPTDGKGGIHRPSILPRRSIV